MSDGHHRVQLERTEALSVGLHGPVQQRDHGVSNGQVPRFRHGLRDAGCGICEVRRHDPTDRAFGPRLALKNAAVPGDACASQGDAKHESQRQFL